MRWQEATAVALYGPDGFFRRTGGPAAHFRTSAHASPLFASALAALVSRLDEALGRPDPFDVVDLGAGRGELLTGMLAALPDRLAARVRARAVELGPAPAVLDGRIAWLDTPPTHVTGLLVATEWLDNVPVEVVQLGADGVPRYVEVTRDGVESPGDPVDGEDLAWLARWWPLDSPGARAEIGRPRDAAWAAAVSTVERGLALAVDYGHLAGDRPLFGSLTGFRDGRETPPVPDGHGDVTSAVALDSLTASMRSGPVPPQLLTQAEALRALGVDGRRPPLSLATTDPAAYVRALARAGAAAELTDVNGLGAHRWVMQWV
jgi:SAM-dependent MidA family methyltransferase